jgi:hypothetical protein
MAQAYRQEYIAQAGGTMSPSISRRVSHPDPLDVKHKPLSIRSLNYPRQPPDVASRVRGEFMEMRGFSPTVEQAARLFDMSRDECNAVLNGLVQQGFLSLTSDGRYRLAS